MIREIERNDIPLCAELIRSCFQTVADQFSFTPENAPYFTAFSTTAEKLFDQYDREHRLMIGYYLEKGEIIGYYSLQFSDHSTCELNNLCVLPEYRHRKIGSDLIMDAFERARRSGCILMNIGIVEKNKQLRQWYEQHGFVHTGTKKFDFFPFTCGYMEKKL